MGRQFRDTGLTKLLKSDFKKISHGDAEYVGLKKGGGASVNTGIKIKFAMPIITMIGLCRSVKSRTRKKGENIMCTNVQQTTENLWIRCERQRDRANKWSDRCVEKDREISVLLTERTELLQKHQQQLEQKEQEKIDLSENLKKEISGLCQKINEKNKLLKDQENELHKQYLTTQQNTHATAIGNRTLEKRKAQRRKKLIEKLVNSLTYTDTGKLVDWLRRAIKRDCGANSHVPVSIDTGWNCDFTGHPGYHTTPSGKTVVTYPNAYGWPTIYHCSTEQIVVGRGWIVRNLHRLAREEAIRRVK